MKATVILRLLIISFNDAAIGHHAQNAPLLQRERYTHVVPVLRDLGVDIPVTQPPAAVADIAGMFGRTVITGAGDQNNGTVLTHIEQRSEIHS